jgi:hypothetical protein
MINVQTNDGIWRPSSQNVVCAQGQSIDPVGMSFQTSTQHSLQTKCSLFKTYQWVYCSLNRLSYGKKDSCGDSSSSYMLEMQSNNLLMMI